MEVTDSISVYGATALQTITALSTISLVFIGVFVALFFLGLRLGKEALVSLIFGLYVGYLAQHTFPFFDTLYSVGPEAIMRGVVLGGFTVVGYLIARRVMWTDYDEGGAANWLDVGLLSLACAFLIAAIVYALFPAFQTPLITPTLTAWVSNPAFLFFWIIAPLGAIFIASRQ